MVNDNRKVLVALSGGLDSAAVVLMLKESHYDVEALYLDITGSAQSRAKAEAVAQMVGVKLHVEPMSDYFNSSIIDYVVAEHRAGRTPSPCGRCNPLIKWEMMCQVASRLGFEKVATGHYVRVGELGGVPTIVKGVDTVKDQSYYLWGLGAEFMSRAVLPLGEMTKLQVRQYLMERGFHGLSGSSESMSLCFLEIDGRKVGYNEFIRHHIGSELRGGEVVDTEGRTVGTHDGYQLYTPGQKRGFSITTPSLELGYNYSVVEVCPKKNMLIVSDSPDDLYCTEILCNSLVSNHLSLLLEAHDISVVVRGLGRNPDGYAKAIESLGDGVFKITLPGKGAWAVAAGQPVVFYQGDMLLGGAIVKL